MRAPEDRPRNRRPLLIRATIGLVGGLLAGGLVVVAAGRLHDGMPDDAGADGHPALAYADQQASRARLVTPTTGPAGRNPTASATPAPAAPAAPLAYRFPVDGRATYGRTHHDYPAADMFARCGSVFVAPVDGVIEHVSRVDLWRASTNEGADRGGLSVALVGRDGLRYYGSHLRQVEPRLRIGLTVRAGDRLGEVGQTGSAEGTGCHLHFGISPACPQLRSADWWSRRGAIPPAPFLDAWRKGRARSPVAAAAAWQRANGCPKAPTAYP
jgi:murein DD-endopeptidase MepM/ murein hydrolase activator NlpD